MRKRRWIQVLVLIAFLFVLYGESVQSDVISQRFETKIEECLQEGYLPVVILTQETGSYDYIGKPALWAAQYAVDQVNAAGGINGCEIRLVSEDTGSEKSRALSLYRGASRKCCIILGPVDAPETAYISQNMESGDKTVHIAAYSYEDSGEVHAPYSISYMSDSVDGELEAVRVYAAENPDIRDVVLFSMSSDESKNSTAMEFLDRQDELGLNILDVVDVAPDADETDYQRYTIQALNQKADGYLFLLSGKDYAEILKELRSHGVEEGRRITASFSTYGSETVQIAGDALDGTYIWHKIDPYYEGEEWQKLLTAYGETGQEEDQVSAPVADYYDAVMAICRCYEEFGITSDNYESFKDNEEIAEWFYDSEQFQGIQGNYSWVNGKKISDYQFFVYEGTVPVNLKSR